jgi:cell division protein FtsL
MKGAGKIILATAFFSALMLVYVHEQMALFHISYELDAKSEKLSRLSEEYRKLKFEVDQLRAPRLLESKLKELSLDLALPKEVRVVKVPVAEPLPAPVSMFSGGAAQSQLFNFLGRWLNVAPAQAKEDAQASALA